MGGYPHTFSNFSYFCQDFVDFADFYKYLTLSGGGRKKMSLPEVFDNTMNTGVLVLNIPAPVMMTPCPPRLQFKTLWMGVILTGKLTFWGDK